MFQWVYNLLEHRAETDRILLEDADPVVGFMLAPDIKWDGQDVRTLYLCAIARVHGIKSLRDLRGREHLPLLRNMQEKIGAFVERRYGLTPAQTRVYLHYQPSFYHLHVHVVNVLHDAPGARLGNGALLQQVIDNLTLMDDYYARCTLTFTAKLNHPLYVAYRDAGRLRLPAPDAKEKDEDTNKNAAEKQQ